MLSKMEEGLKKQVKAGIIGKEREKKKMLKGWEKKMVKWRKTDRRNAGKLEEKL